MPCQACAAGTPASIAATAMTPTDIGMLVPSRKNANAQLM